MPAPRLATLSDLPESVLLEIASYDPRTITISHDPTLTTEFKVYCEAHTMPALLQLNRQLRAKAQKIYRLSFAALLNGRPLYFQFSFDTIAISSIEAFREFLIPIGYSAGAQNALWKERQFMDRELQYLAFDTPLYWLCMQTLVRFRKLREVAFVEWPEVVGVKTRHMQKNPVEVESDLLALTMELWKMAAVMRKQVAFQVPEMVQYSKGAFESLFQMHETDSEYAEFLQGKVQNQTGKSQNGKGAIVSKL